EQVKQQRCRIDDDRRHVAEVRLSINRRTEVDGGEENATLQKCEVPKTRYEHESIGTPNVLVRDPHPIGHRRCPVTGPPFIGDLLPNPATRNPEVVSIGWGDVRPPLERSRWRRQIGEFLRFAAGPKTTHPSP